MHNEIRLMSLFVSGSLTNMCVGGVLFNDNLSRRSVYHILLSVFFAVEWRGDHCGVPEYRGHFLCVVARS